MKYNSTTMAPANSFRIGEVVGYRNYPTEKFQVVGIRTLETSHDICEMELFGDWSEAGRCITRSWVMAANVQKVTQ